MTEELSSSEIEKVILCYIHNSKITANQLALFHVLYNESYTCFSFMEIAERTGKRDHNGIGEILSWLAQSIDRMEGDASATARKYGTTGWTFLFDQYDNDIEGKHIKMKDEFRRIIDQSPALKLAMEKPIERLKIIYTL